MFAVKPSFDRRLTRAEQETGSGAVHVVESDSRIWQGMPRVLPLTRSCALRTMCPKYSEARQQCAVAGNYDRCMSIKLGGDSIIAQWSCTTSGEPVPLAADMPSFLECLLP